MSQTHENGQRLATHDECGRTIRLKPERSALADGTAWCDKCGVSFEVGGGVE